ncbi:MAG: T9SS type A sorting domain-containing protein, partial [Bacteroidaceae bacterium]|nr:T9SS type A sorting domain-containing protein [Bacteroidaceae bacterium]
HPMGNNSYLFTGSYDGQFYPITNIPAMFIGMADGATVTRVAIESGNIASNTDIATHCGSIIGAVGTSLPCNISYCYSKADMSGGTDVGGIAGKYYGNINYCYFAGTIDGTSTVGGLIGSSHDGTYGFTAKNCFVYTNLLVGNVTYLGDLIGYCHEGSKFQDIWTTSTIGKVGGYMGGQQENINFVSEEEFFSGMVAYSLNELAPTTTWYQNLGEDLYPVLNPTHKTVIISAEGTIVNGDPGTAIENIDMTSSERTNVYDLQGRLIRTNVAVRNSLVNLPKGIYIVGGKKVLK